MERFRQENEIAKLMQSTYAPVEDMECATRGHSYARLAVMRAEQRDHICGQARRVGYVSASTNALALYRLKIRVEEHRNPAVGWLTLPGYFVLEQRCFSVMLEVDSMSQKNEAPLSQMLSTLGQHSRWRLLCLLAPRSVTEPLGLIERQPHELAASLHLAPSTVCEHLRKLSDLSLVVARRQGHARFYRLLPSPALSSFLAFLTTFQQESFNGKAPSDGPKEEP